MNIIPFSLLLVNLLLGIASFSQTRVDVEKLEFRNGEAIFEGNSFTGTTVSYHSDKDGAIKAETPYLKGKKQGTEIAYYKTGEKESETSYVNGLKHGPFTRYYESGEKSVVSRWKDDVRFGKTIGWHENGKISFDAVYEGRDENSHVIIVYYKTFFDNGVLETEKKYDSINHELIYSAEWISTGLKTKELFFENGVTVRTWYLEDGNEISDIVVNEVISRTIIFKNGSKCIREIKRNKLLSESCWDAEGVQVK